MGFASSRGWACRCGCWRVWGEPIGAGLGGGGGGGVLEPRRDPGDFGRAGRGPDRFQPLRSKLPGYATPLVFLGYVLIGVCGALTFHQRRERRLYVSQWFLFAALFWFPWIYSTAQLLLLTFPVRGVMQSVIAWWFADNLELVWFWLAGLAAVFILCPSWPGGSCRTAIWRSVPFGSSSCSAVGAAFRTAPRYRPGCRP